MEFLGIDILDKEDFLELFVRSAFNLLVIWYIVKSLYYPANKNKDYVFTYLLISTVVFFLCFLLENVKLELGFALGLFAVFGIIRYRTETISVKEMTYLFIVIGLSVMNALANKKISYFELLFANISIVFLLDYFERNWMLQRSTKSKYVLYEKIDMIGPEKRDELVEDIQKRTGLRIEKLEIEQIDLVRDTAKIKIYFVE
ncbi:MAG: DUF4956 domain-containing protein [Flavobacteriales bacterium TMED113]|nr:MAG: DUF4956 domain-containing protein [Flavobacteriales bacterium TMED113]|tara:strand:- start:1606 stop:2208 length:603 start_codon:yes stop_codon:yes gene_type:complete